jgi:hypothetical protein
MSRRIISFLLSRIGPGIAFSTAPLGELSFAALVHSRLKTERQEGRCR